MVAKQRTKRETLEALFAQESNWKYVPAAFFTHFENECHAGEAAIDKHIEFFRYTNMDFVKIQYEKAFPKLDFIRKPKDWLSMPFYGAAFFEEPLEIVKGLVKKLKKEAVILQTIYSPYMCAADSTSHELITEHLREDPDSVARGLSIIRDSIQGFVDECVKAGIDGFYSSTQGGEHLRFAEKADFEKYVMPFDISVLTEMNERARFNILHICDYWLPYDSIDIFLRYPCRIVSAPTSLCSGRKINLNDLYNTFGKPVLGGMNRKGVIKKGPVDQIAREVQSLLSEAPDRFMLGADCTVADANWDYLRAAVSMAHDYRTS